MRSLFNRTLNSVIFGISLMLLTAVYIALGSGVAPVREYFEMNEMQFFNAWPLKVLMGLLVVNLATVTWTRIPFTRPRYGVWCVHSGIIVLIFGMAHYYNMKVEGLTMIPLGQTVDHFYDTDQRALYVQVSDGGSGALASYPLESLPRFKTYLPELNNTAILDRADLRDIRPEFNSRDPQTRQPRKTSLKELLKLPDELRLDVVGYYPYGKIVSDWIEDAGVDEPAVVLSIANPHTGAAAEFWLVAGDAQHAGTVLGTVELEHRHVREDESIRMVQQVAGKMHQLEIAVGDYKQTIFVEPGTSYDLGTSGYKLAIENFNPAFPTTDGQVVPLLTMMVTTPKTTFRRQVIAGRQTPTDWLLNVEGAGPMGKRQKEPLDNDLKISYAFNDPMHLLPSQGAVKHTFYTSAQGAMTDIVTAMDAPAQVREVHEGKGQIDLPMGQRTFTMQFRRSEHAKRVDSVEAIPSAQRSREQGQSGVLQVALVKASMGSWSTTVPVPFMQWAADARGQWDGPVVKLPGTNARIQLQLGNTQYQLPAKITLEKFELEHYMGGSAEVGIPRDFKSTLSIEDKSTGQKMVDVAHMNHPVYFPPGLFGKSWTFFQAQWDPDGQRWTVLGVGNRHGTWTMTLGCVMIFVGLLYAFYLKPIIIRRMKKQALLDAAQAKRRQPVEMAVQQA
jgi:hypothetical protein